MLDIGKDLKELRLSKGLSLKEISEMTKINITYLEYLEQNNFNFLPEIYVRSFLKNYIKVLEGDEKKFLNALEEILHPSEKTKNEFEEENIVAPSNEKGKNSLKKFLIGKSNIITPQNVTFLLITTLIIIISFILILNRGNGKHESTSSPTEEKMYDQVPESSENFVNIASDDSLILGINAKDSVWIQVKMDNSAIQEVYLRTGESKKFKAKNNFQLLIGNAGAVALHLNETELPFTGVKGSVKRLKIDRNGLEFIQVKNEHKVQ